MNLSILYSVSSRVFKILSGPIILIALSNNLSDEELAIYYVFFNIIAFKQLAELGVGFVIKQSISHDSYDLEKNGSLILDKVNFCASWFSKVAFFVLIIIGPLGSLYLMSVNTVVDWKYAWLLLVISSAISLLINPLLIYLEGIQKLNLVYRARLIQSIIYGFLLAVFIMSGFQLYSIALAIIISNSIIYILVRKNIPDDEIKYSLTKKISSESSVIRYELWPLIRKTAIVWGVGVVFWNAINLIAIKMIPLADAGKLAFSLAIAKAGYNICESLLSPQLSKFGNIIGSGHVSDALREFTRARYLSIFVMMIGFGLCFMLHTQLNHWIFNHKLITGNDLALVLAFYFVLFLMTSKNNFIRCFKIEPFVWVSVFNSLAVPVLFYVSVKYNYDYYMLFPLVALILSYWYSKFIFKNIISNLICRGTK